MENPRAANTQWGKREPRPAKYQYSDAEGNVQTWTGQGRQPVPIREAIAQGKTLNDFLI